MNHYITQYILFIFICLTFQTNKSLAQSIDSADFVSNMPRIDIWTETGDNPPYYGAITPDSCFGATILGNEYVRGRMRVIIEDSIYYDSNYYIPSKDSAGIKIKIRGNGTGFAERPPFKIKLGRKDDPLNLGHKNKEWVLLNSSTMLLKLPIGYRISDIVSDRWHPRYILANLFFNDEYFGLYYFTDPIDKNKKRIDISDSGFLIENDNYWWKEDVYFKTTNTPSFMGYTFKYPDTEEIDSTTFNNIIEYMNEVEYAVQTNTSVEKYIDIQSFADYLLLSEIMGILDYQGSNMYLYKHDIKDTSKLTMGPLWDMDSSFLTEEEYSPHRKYNCFFILHHLINNNKDFKNAYQKKLNKIKNDLTDNVFSYLDSIEVTGEFVDKALQASTNGECSLENEIQEARDWFSSRLNWLEANTSLNSIHVDSHISFIQILNMNGTIIYDSSTTEDKPIIAPGIYVLVYGYENGTISHQKILQK